MWKKIDFSIDFSGFVRFPGGPFFACFTFGKEGKLQENKQKEENVYEQTQKGSWKYI